MIAVENTQHRNDYAGGKAQEIHDVEDPQFSLLVAAKRWAVTNVPDIASKPDETFCSLIHDQSLRFSFKGC
jgi:hypothetical protein